MHDTRNKAKTEMTAFCFDPPWGVGLWPTLRPEFFRERSAIGRRPTGDTLAIVLAFISLRYELGSRFAERAFLKGLHIAVVLFESAGEDVRAVVAGDEIEIVGLGRECCGPQ